MGAQGQECDEKPGLRTQLRSLDVPCRSWLALEESLGGQGTQPELGFSGSTLEMMVLSTTRGKEAGLEAAASRDDETQAKA